MNKLGIILGVALGAAVEVVIWAHEEQVISVGQNAGGSLVIDSDFPQPVELPASIFPGINGYATGELAFHSTILDEPDLDFFQLVSTANFKFVLLAKDSGIEIWNDTGSAFMNVNETFSIGAAPFDSHPIWNIVSSVPGAVYSVTLKLQDLNGVYADSDAFVISFTPGVDRPKLDLALIGPQQIALSWPTNDFPWELRSATTVNAVNWAVVTNAPAVVSSNYVVTLPATQTQQFFRLQLP